MAARKEPSIVIPVGDWDEEYLKEEPDISSEDSLISLLQTTKYGPQKIGRLAIMARERGAAPEDIISANKLLLNAGAAVEVSAKAAAHKRKVELPDGREIEVREFVAPVREKGEGHFEGDTQATDASPSPQPDNEPFVSVISDTARTRALDYLLKIVPGYIYGRLAIIAANGGDVHAAADALKAKIDEVVERLG